MEIRFNLLTRQRRDAKPLILHADFNFEEIRFSKMITHTFCPSGATTSPKNKLPNRKTFCIDKSI
ncbi:hypothetical protein BDV93DRAFT_522170 [Ceratobasidium sp. AG-I]|nr:hypothetical protein BDV93DRAFT_522170 [Ceratobasidium sp. AG-I]